MFEIDKIVYEPFYICHATTDLDGIARMRIEGANLDPVDALRLGVDKNSEKDRGPFIGTYTGRFWPYDPRPEDFTIDDVIHSLSSISRYTGHGMLPYSVAEHSVHIWRWLCAQNADHDTRMAGLLHDAPEALSGFGDVASPVKLPQIKSVETAIWERAIVPKFDLPVAIPDLVHEADSRIVADETMQNMHTTYGDDPLGVMLEYWDEERARAEFRRAFHQTQCARQQNRRAA